MFRLPEASRLEAWRNFRRSLDELEFEEALARTAEFWTPAPHTAYYLDPDDVESWPDPWTLVEENYYCDLDLTSWKNHYHHLDCDSQPLRI